MKNIREPRLKNP